ncbi:MAG: hypothetical protein N2689_03315 [Verrucomicrobiae bacterium]|nr:hypothetical protein [Verrucomicrobiae bacterium]
MKKNLRTGTTAYMDTGRKGRATQFVTSGGFVLFVHLVCFVVASASALAIPGFTKFQDLNTAFGVPLWQGDSLWTENERDVAKRLGWPEESRTSTLGSYRLYPKEEMKVLGTRAFSLALYAEKGRVTQVSMVFANRGDYAKKSDMDRAAQAIEATLKPVLGDGTQSWFGQSRNVRYKVRRWNWKNHAILLETPEPYVGVRIMPSDLADKEGRGEMISYQELRQTLAQRVQRRSNGDVVIGEMPMVNQGPKGYCVPATWERYLRYLGIQADMYVLAMAGGTRTGGGTSSEQMFEAVSSLARRNGRRFEEINEPLTIPGLAKLIDKGFPVMWGIFFDKELEKKITLRSKDRANVTDWNAWLQTLASARGVGKVAKEMKPDPQTGVPTVINGHMRMIIGYNAKTKEIAMTDSWGEQFKERWLTVEEAQAMSQDKFWQVRW